MEWTDAEGEAEAAKGREEVAAADLAAGAVATEGVAATAGKAAAVRHTNHSVG